MQLAKPDPVHYFEEDVTEFNLLRPGLFLSRLPKAQQRVVMQMLEGVLAQASR